jgi:excinuclease UvrABC nuclease subunit
MASAKATAAFDRKFGKPFLDSLPRTPGVYLIYSGEGVLIYVGKAKNLRRRLSQYRNAKRRRKHRKMRSIIAEADRIEFETQPTDLDALIRETRLIQEHRPKWNVAGAFYFLYPMIGVRIDDGIAHFCYTTQPELFPGFQFHGAYRSRHLTRNAYFALVELLSYVGHRQSVPRSKRSTVKYSHVRGFRQIGGELLAKWEKFFKGESNEAAEALVLALIENAGARGSPKEIQENLNHLKRFWRFEATPLFRARSRTAYAPYPVSQKDRDILFLNSIGGAHESRHSKSLERTS